jgi:hypothetical protein
MSRFAGNGSKCIQRLTSTCSLFQGVKHNAWESLPSDCAIHEGLKQYKKFWSKSKDIAKCLQNVTIKRALLPAIASLYRIPQRLYMLSHAKYCTSKQQNALFQKVHSEIDSSSTRAADLIQRTTRHCESHRFMIRMNIGIEPLHLSALVHSLNFFLRCCKLLHMPSKRCGTPIRGKAAGATSAGDADHDREPAWARELPSTPRPVVIFGSQVGTYNRAVLA